MKRTSRWTLMLSMLLLPLMGLAQTFPVDGYVLDSNGGALAGATVWLDYSLPNGTWTNDTTSTNSNGYFTFGTVNTATQGAMIVMAECALNNYVLDTLMYDPTTTGWTTTLSCGPIVAGPCDPAFSITPQPGPFNPYTYWIQPTGNNGPNASSFFNFGNGNSGYTGGVLQAYPGPGTYTVCHVVSNGACVDSLCQTFTIPPSTNCVADFYSWTSAGTTYFGADSMNWSGATTYSWDFGDGSTGSGNFTSHNYAQSDSFYVCMVASDPVSGCIDTVCKWIAVNIQPSCSISFTWTNPQSSVYTFSPINSGSGTPVSVLWTFGDGSSSTSTNPTHAYNGPGTYSVCLQATFANGCVANTCYTLTIAANPGCNSDFYPYQSSPNTFTFVPMDSSYNPSSYHWNFGDGTTVTGTSIPTHTYSTADTFLVCLVVTTANCLDSTCYYVVSSGTTGGNCTAQFSYQATPAGQVFFVNQSAGVTSASNFLWNLGDGSTSTAINPVHNYSAAGTYNVCLTIQTANCTDSICMPVTVNGPGPVNCSAPFTATDLGNGVWTFSSDSTVTGGFYSVDPGDGGQPVFGGPVLTYQYSASGTYAVCFTMVDSLNNCIATECDTINVQVATPTCSAGFVYSATTIASTFAFTDSSWSPNGPVTYLWDFGDSTTSTTQSPTHTYNTPGPWYVCLTITDATGCTDTYCDIVFPTNAPGTYNVSGVVVTDSLLGTQSFVYLIQHDSVANTLTAVDSQYAQFGFYSFYSVPPGSYLVKAGLQPSSPFYAGHLPTYHGDVLMWNQAIATVVTNSDVWNLPITLVQGNNPGGPGFIGGLISQGANKDGDPLPDISVILMTIDDEPVTHTMTNADGEYAFSNLAYGTYIVHVEIPGKPAEDWIVTLDANNPSFELGDFDVHTDHIDAVGSTSIATGLNPNSVKVYPNPSSSMINIALDLEAQGARIELVNSLGAVIESIHTRTGNVTRQMDLSGLANGVYLIQVTTDSGSLTHRVMKR